MANDADNDTATKPIECRSYTHSRRFPLVIGNIQGLQLRIPWTPAQLGIAVGTWIALALTRGLWGHLTPLGNALVFLGLPPFLAWKARVEPHRGPCAVARRGRLADVAVHAADGAVLAR